MLPFLLIGPKFVSGVVPMIASASQTIDIIIFDWRLYKGQPEHPVMKLTLALAGAVARGVVVRVLGANALTRANLEVLGLKTRPLFHDKIVHAKVMCIDGRFVVLGSHNYTQSAFTRNLEVSLIVDSGQIGFVFTTYFNNLWGV